MVLIYNLKVRVLLYAINESQDDNFDTQAVLYLLLLYFQKILFVTDHLLYFLQEL